MGVDTGVLHTLSIENVNGQCTEVPSEPAESGFCARIKLTAYATAERGGVIWIYMGPRDSTPPLPEFEWATVPDDHPMGGGWPLVELPGDRFVNPIGKAFKRVSNGRGDSITYFYEALVAP